MILPHQNTRQMKASNDLCPVSNTALLPSPFLSTPSTHTSEMRAACRARHDGGPLVPSPFPRHIIIIIISYIHPSLRSPQTQFTREIPCLFCPHHRHHAYERHRERKSTHTGTARRHERERERTTGPPGQRGRARCGGRGADGERPQERPTPPLSSPSFYSLFY